MQAAVKLNAPEMGSCSLNEYPSFYGRELLEGCGLY